MSVFSSGKGLFCFLPILLFNVFCEEYEASNMEDLPTVRDALLLWPRLAGLT